MPDNKRRLLIVLAALAILLGGLVWWLPKFSQRFLARQLAVYGVEDYQLGAIDIGPDALQLDSLALSGEWQDTRFELTTGPVNVGYNWGDLAHGRLGAILVANAVVKLELLRTQAQAQAQAQAQNTTAAAATTLAPQQSINTLEQLQLPFKQLTLAALSIKFSGDVPAPIQISGKQLIINNDTQRISGDLFVESPEVVSAVAVAAANGLLSDMQLHISLVDSVNRDWLPDVHYDLTLEQRKLVSGDLQWRGDKAQGQVSTLVIKGESILDDLLPLADRIESGAAIRQWLGASSKNSQLSSDLTFTAKIPVPAQLTILPNQAYYQSVDQLPWSLLLSLQSHAQALNVAGFKPKQLQFDLAIDGPLANLSVQQHGPLQVVGSFDTSLLAELPSAIGLTEASQISAVLNSQQPIKISLPAGEFKQLTATEPVLSLAAATDENSLGADWRIQSLQYQSGQLKLQSQLSANFNKRALPTLTLDLEGSALPTLELTGHYAVADASLNGQWRLNQTGDDAWRLGGEGEITSLHAVTELTNKWSLLPDLALASGKATLDFRFASGMTPTMQNQFALHAKDISGVYDSIAFSGVSVDASLSESAGSWISAKPIDIHAVTVSPGVAIDNVSVQVSGEKIPDRWRLDAIDAELFGGRVTLSQPAQVSYPFSGNRVPLHLSGIDLGRVLALYKEAGVNGNGHLSGDIPVILDANGVEIVDGMLNNTEPGHIAYKQESGGALGKSNPQLAMALRLLEDFHYHRLQVSTDFNKEGTLALGLQLFGSNPQQFSGQEVNFNINVEDDLLGHLKALQLSDELRKRIEKKLQR